MGEWEHGRTTREGCATSVAPTGVGIGEWVALVRLSREGFLARTGEDRGSLPTFPHYKLVKKSGTGMQVLGDDSTVRHSMINDAVRVIRGTSWLGMAVFYFAKLSGATPSKLPAMFLPMAFLSRTIGVGAFAPARAVMKALWICVRLFFDYIPDTEGAFGLRFWISGSPVTWPAWNVIRQLRLGNIDSPRPPLHSTAMSGHSGAQSSNSARGSVSRTN